MGFCAAPLSRDMKPSLPLRVRFSRPLQAPVPGLERDQTKQPEAFRAMLQMNNLLYQDHKMIGSSIDP